MAKYGVFKNGFIGVSGVNLSDHCTEFTLEESSEELANAAHGDETAQVTPGLLNWTIRATFLQDFAASSVDLTLRPLLANRTSFGVTVRASGDAVSTTNPMYSGTAVLVSYKGIGGPHGGNLMAEAVFRPAAGTALARQTA